MFSIRALLRDLRESIRMAANRPKCHLCGGKTRHRDAYNRPFSECVRCGFIFANDYDPASLSEGMGMEGSWSGPAGGGYREYYLARMMVEKLGLERILLFGTGNTPTLERLIDEGVDVVGTDISQDVVNYKRKRHGQEAYYTPDDLPGHRKFDAIISVEVFEHFPEPRRSFDQLVRHLVNTGVICGTTNFYPGGPMEDGNSPGYMSLKSHLAYWSSRSMAHLAREYGMVLAEFELICPGSVKPDETYGQLYPNKRVFFIYHESQHDPFFKELAKTTPILPIDKP